MGQVRSVTLAMDFDEFSDDELAEFGDAGDGGALDAPLSTVSADDGLGLDDGFDLDDDEQAQLDLEHEQVYSADSAFKERDEAAEAAEEEATRLALEQLLNRSQANDTFEHAQSALQTVDHDALSRQRETDENLQRTVPQRKTWTNTLRRQRANGSEPPVTRKQAQAQLAQKHEENMAKKAEAKKKLMKQFQADLSKATATIEVKVPVINAQVADWGLDDVQGWLSQTVSRANLSRWCSIVQEHNMTGAVLLTIDKTTLESHCKGYYTLAPEVPVVHAGIKVLKKEGSMQGKRTLRRLFSSAVRSRSSSKP